MKLHLLQSKYISTFIVFVAILLGVSNTVWAAIALRGTATTATNTTPSLTINKPTGIVAGDVMIVNIAQVGNNTTAPALTGWSLIDGRSLAGTTLRYGAVLYRVANGTEGTNFTFALGTGTNSSSGAIVAFSGVDGTNTFDVATGTISVQVSQTAVAATSITSATANAAIIMFGMAANSIPTWSGWTTTSPGALTELYDNQSTNASVGAAWATKVGAGATGPGAATLSANQRSGGILIALRAALPPTITTLSPSTGCQGATGIVITGTNFTGVTAVKFNEVSASYVVNSATQITATVPMSATTGNITVTTSGGTATSPSSFTVNPLPGQPSPINGTTTCCSGFPQTYSVTNVVGITYNWTFPSDWSQTGGGTTNSVTVNVGSTSGNIQVTPTNGCGAGASQTLGVTIGTPSIIGSSGSRCGPGTVDLGANASAGTINWFDAGGNWLKTGTNYTTPSLSTTTTYYVEANDGSCTTSRTTVEAVIISPASISVGGAGAYCNGSTISLTSSGANLTNQYWTGPNAFYNNIDQNPVIPGATAVNAGTYTVTGSALSGINLVANSDFELGNIGFSSSYTYIAPATNALVPEGLYTIVTNPQSVHNSFSACADHTPSGTLMMVVNGAQDSQNIWTQTVNVVENTAYQFTYWVQSVHPTSPSRSQLYVNGAPQALPYSADATTCTWKQFVYNWTSGPGINSAVLELRNQNLDKDGNDFALDDIVFQQACEATASGVVTVNPIPTAGTIGNAQTICRGYRPTAITSTMAGTGTGTISYEWQTNASGSYVTIPGATAATYYPPALFANTSYQRSTIDVSGGATCSSPYTTPVTITVDGPTATPGGPDVVCQSASPVAFALTGASVALNPPKGG